MNKLDKIHGLFLLFVLLVLVLVINPRIIKNIYNSFLGRIILIIIVLFFAMNSMSLGLLTALVFILASNMVFREGVTDMSTATDMQDANASTTDEEDQKKTQGAGVSATDDTLVQSDDSAKLPVSLPGSSENVLPAEGFQSMYASF